MKEFNPRSQLRPGHNDSSVDQSIGERGRFWAQRHVDEEDDTEKQDDDSQAAWSADSLSYENNVSMRDPNYLVAAFTQDSESSSFSDAHSSFYPPTLPTQSGQSSPISFSTSRSRFGGRDSDNGYRLERQARARDEDRRRQGRLLLVSLLENFCAVYAQSPERNRKLFFTICRMLSAMGVIEEEFMDEMSAVRSSYQRAFRDLFMTALNSIREEQSLPTSSPLLITPASVSDGLSPSNPSGYSDGYFPDYRIIPSSRSSSGTVTPTGVWPLALTLEHMFSIDESRYLTDFAELGMIGRGGFASVWRARNKLDGIAYAVKKVRLESTEFVGARAKSGVGYDKIFREIKGLARLEHPNVVRYYGSWLEYVVYIPKPASQRGLGWGSHALTMHTVTQSEEIDEEEDEPHFGSSDSLPRITQQDLGGVIMQQGIPVNNKRTRPLVTRNGSNNSNGSRASTSLSPNTASDSSSKKMLSTSLEEGPDEDEVEEIRRRDNSSLRIDGNNWPRRGPAREPRSLMLFIQMQLCRSTLLDYITSRNTEVARHGGEAVDERVNLRLFHGAVRGVAYIHDQGLIHRDLKPSNIFLSVVPDTTTGRDDAKTSGSPGWEARQNEKVTAAFVKENLNSIVPKIGDFGLVTNMEQEIADAVEQAWRMTNTLPSPAEKCGCDESVGCQGGESCLISNGKPRSSTKSSTRTSGVGTITYASPEQLANSPRPYNEKSDVYSLGIILFELFHPFATAMERAQLLRELRRGVLPDWFVKRWPKESALILWMMTEDPEQRPSVKQLLEIELSVAPSKYTEIDLQARLLEKSRALDAKTREAEQLKRRVEELEMRLQRTEVRERFDGSSGSATGETGLEIMGYVKRDWT